MSTIEPGKRAQDLLREADEAYRRGAWGRLAAAADLARAYYAAAQLDLFERQWTEAREEAARQDAALARILPPEVDDASA